MSQIDINSILSQMRTLAAQTKLAPPVASPETNPASKTDFGTVLAQSIGKIDESLRSANTLTTSFERGDPSSDIGSVMVALQKADLSFRAMSEVRNKLVDAYKDIMNMQI